jgi:methyl-accepting chemotaxis protein
MRIHHKLITMMLVILIVPNLIIGTVGYFIAKNHLENLGETTLKNGVEAAMQLVDSMNKQVEAGDLSLEEAQEQAKIYLIGEQNSEGKRDISNPIDLGEHGYFVVYDEKGLEVAHPSIEGENVWDVKDVDGKLFVQEQIQTAQAGGGFTTYKWTLPNNEKVIAEKISYNQLEPHWGWVISAGTYKSDFNEGANEVLKSLMATLLAATVAGGLLAFFFSKRISNPIVSITERVKEVAKGNLAIEMERIQRKDEIGELVSGFNEMTDGLRTLIGKVQHSIHDITNTSQNLSAVAQETTASSEEVGRAIEEISQGAVQQASDADDTNQNTIKLTEQIQALFAKTEQMKQASIDVGQSNQLGMESVKILRGKSQETDHSVQQAQVVTEALTEKVKEIEAIIGTINQISEQTNLLALNASIEAARAGDHGKGFAVVASEVRKLAEQTSEATEKVRQTLTGIISETDKANAEMKKTQGLAKEQTKAVQQTEKSFDIIDQSIKGISGIIGEVNHHIQLLVTLKENVSSSVENIAAVSQESAASTEEITSSMDEQLKAISVVADSAAELNDLISGLKQEVNKFRY